ncbi:MAG: hypothetical protein IT324_11100 [Anaerolineae bacterium]|nr:hypothetical protein [Anaerolineae bacterium]
MSPLIAVVGAGLVVVVALAFWATIQNWIAEVIHRAQDRLGRFTHTLQSALVTLDRLMVNGQRIIMMTGRTLFKEQATSQVVTIEEARPIDPQALPADVLAKLDKGASLTYHISGSES